MVSKHAIAQNAYREVDGCQDTDAVRPRCGNWPPSKRPRFPLDVVCISAIVGPRWPVGLTRAGKLQPSCALATSNDTCVSYDPATTAKFSTTKGSSESGSMEI